MPATPSTYLGFLSNLPKILMSLARWKPKAQLPKLKRASELERASKELVEWRRAMRLEEEMMMKALAAKRKEEQRKRDRELRKAKYEKKLLQAQMNTRRMSEVWYRMPPDQNLVTALGIFFFYIFYQTVVLSYRKNQKDYEDPLKIEMAEAEERRKIKQLERGLAGMEPYAEDENEGSGKEDPQRGIMKCMKSGARVVRRCEPRKLPRYLGKTVDVKFSDVAGLGKLKLEPEEM